MGNWTLKGSDSLRLYFQQHGNFFIVQHTSVYEQKENLTYFFSIV